jgi:signal transduction histidine kinase
VRSTYAHRVAAEQLLTDYAHLAAERLAGAVNRDLNYYAFYPAYYFLLKSLSDEAGANMPSADPSAPSLNRQQRQALESVDFFFAFGLGDSSVQSSATPQTRQAFEDAHLAELTRLGRSAAGESLPYRLIAASSIVAGVEVIASRDAVQIIGFQLNDGALEELLGRSSDRLTLIPTELSRGASIDSLLSIEIKGRHGTPRIQRGSSPHAEQLSFVAAAALDSQLDSLNVTVTLPASIAAQLLAGGMPRSSSPIALTMLAVVIVCLIALLQLMRRESELARLRAEFVSGISHEFRTPLAQIRMFAETLALGRVRTDAEATRSLEIMDQEARRLTLLVETALHFSRVERGVTDTHLCSCQVDELLQQVVDGFRPLANSKNATVNTSGIEAVVADVDADALTQLVLNLLDNALKYGPVGQTISISLARHDQQMRLTIEDQGPGIPAAHRDLVWGRFERLQRDRDAGITGTGIGLAVVVDIVAQHQGRAWIADPGLSEHGTRIIVDIPLSSNAEAPLQ